VAAGRALTGGSAGFLVHSGRTGRPKGQGPVFKQSKSAVARVTARSLIEGGVPFGNRHTRTAESFSRPHVTEVASSVFHGASNERRTALVVASSNHVTQDWPSITADSLCLTSACQFVTLRRVNRPDT
jgi:hypothetical protein